MLSSLEKVKDALLTVTTSNVYHYTAPANSTRYIVWAEDMEYASLQADNYKPGITIEGTIDLYTKDEDDEYIYQIPVALNEARIMWELNSVQYEDETKFKHFEWLFRVRQYYGNDLLQGT